MHAYSSGLQSGDAAKILRVLQLAIGAEGHCVWETCGSRQSNRDPAFEICGEQQRKLGVTLQPIKKFGSLVRARSQKKRAVHRHAHRERTHVILLHRVAELQVVGTLHIEEAGAAPDHEDLSDLLFESQLAQRLLRPSVAFARLANWSHALIFFFGEYRRSKAESR